MTAGVAPVTDSVPSRTSPVASDTIRIGMLDAAWVSCLRATASGKSHAMAVRSPDGRWVVLGSGRKEGDPAGHDGTPAHAA